MLNIDFTLQSLLRDEIIHDSCKRKCTVWTLALNSDQSRSQNFFLVAETYRDILKNADGFSKHFQERYKVGKPSHEVIIVFAEVIQMAAHRSFIHLYTLHYATTHSLAGDLWLKMRAGGHQTPNEVLIGSGVPGDGQSDSIFLLQEASFAFKILSKTPSEAQTGYLPPSVLLSLLSRRLAFRLLHPPR